MQLELLNSGTGSLNAEQGDLGHDAILQVLNPSETFLDVDARTHLSLRTQHLFSNSLQDPFQPFCTVNLLHTRADNEDPAPN